MENVGNTTGDTRESNPFEEALGNAPSFEEHMSRLEAEALRNLSFENIIQDINATDVDVPDTLNSTNPDAKAEFMEHPELAVPNNTHDNLDINVVSMNVAYLEKLEEELPYNSTLSEKEKRTLEMTLRASKLKNDFLLANAEYNQNPTEENAEFHRAANEALYGMPEAEVFSSLVYEKLDKIEARELNPEQEQEYKELKQLLGPLERPETERFRPKPETVARFSEMVNDYMAPIFEHIPDGQESFTPEETAGIIKEALADFVPEDSEWQVIVEPNRTNINVNQNEKIIRLAGKRAKGDLTREGLKKILAHEVGTHFLRALPYENNPIEMARTGMPDYEAFEEGVAKAMEQGVTGKYEDSGVNHYISIGLANLLRKDFRTTYEIQRRLAELSSGKNQDSVLYNSVQRAFRGTDVLPNNKDLVYYNGAERVWKFIEHHIDDPELFDKLFLNGKTDIENADHERLAYEMKVGGV